MTTASESDEQEVELSSESLEHVSGGVESPNGSGRTVDGSGNIRLANSTTGDLRYPSRLDRSLVG